MCTVGQISAAPGASNVIAGAVNFTVDIRARRDSVREGMLSMACPFVQPCSHEACCIGVVEHVISNIEAACKERNLGCAIQRKVSRRRIHRSWLLSCADPVESRPSCSTTLAPWSARPPCVIVWRRQQPQ